MQFGRVHGTAVCTMKAEGLQGLKLLIVQPLDKQLRPTGALQVAVDVVQAGPGDLCVMARSREAALAMPDGTRVLWRLFSRVAPLVNEDYSYNLQNEREICAYETTVQNGQIGGLIPRRYSQGVAQGLSRVTVAKLDG